MNLSIEIDQNFMDEFIAGLLHRLFHAAAAAV